MAVKKFKLGNTVTLLSDGSSGDTLNSLANNALALSAAQDNTQGQTSDGATLADFELVWSYGTGPTTGAVSVWILGAPDGTNYEDGSSSVTPGRAPDFVFTPRYSINTAQRQTVRTTMPAGKWKALLKNDATSQAWASSGNTLKVRPVWEEFA